MNQEQYFETIKTYKLLANKSLGQNFLINPKVAQQIVDLLEIKEIDNILEIGAGLGSLSYFLIQKPANSIHLIDIDERMLQFLHENFDKENKVQIRRQNVLKDDLSKYEKIIGNLPYYITSSIIEKILTSAKQTRKIVLMTQKEVYSKLLPKNKSPLSLLLNYVATISSPIEINRNNFTPVPHVDSVVFSLTPNEHIKEENTQELLKLMQQLFLLRRKNILNNLINVIHDKEQAKDILTKLNIDPNKRPEELDINFYIQVLNLIK